MTPKELFQEIAALSPDQQASVYSFVYLLKHPDYLPFEKKPTVEPFANEREALNFANYYTERALNETR
ncbi:hypothetical protein NO1_1576 [Candidatus Termititenax aidoneus]|uniref:Uncharacterized protein n=1 Tax=Termititenax aidoneus TaxID=2218524 RepID=A0A388TCM6_TERA1|nr:hypothetical protein NO1_1576 [Candidatus Termititenax aidoneus]